MRDTSVHMYTHPAGSGEFLIYASGLIIPGGEKPQLPPDMYFKVIQEGIAKNMTRLWEESKNVVFIVNYELYTHVTGETQQKWFAYLLVVPPPPVIASASAGFPYTG
jgi:hypothetical protein